MDGKVGLERQPGAVPPTSYAPISQVAIPSPLPSSGRGKPRWSVAGGGQSSDQIAGERNGLRLGRSHADFGRRHLLLLLLLRAAALAAARGENNRGEQRVTASSQNCDCGGDWLGHVSLPNGSVPWSTA